MAKEMDALPFPEARPRSALTDAQAKALNLADSVAPLEEESQEREVKRRSAMSVLPAYE